MSGRGNQTELEIQKYREYLEWCMWERERERERRSERERYKEKKIEKMREIRKKRVKKCTRKGFPS